MTRRNDPSKGRGDGKPSMLSTLRREVQHAEQRASRCRSTRRAAFLSTGRMDPPGATVPDRTRRMPVKALNARGPCRYGLARARGTPGLQPLTQTAKYRPS